MGLFSSRQIVEFAMKRRELVARIVLLATFLLLAPAVSGAPVQNGFRLINKEVPYPPEGSSQEADVDVQDLHSLNNKNPPKTVTNISDIANHHVSSPTADDAKRSLNNDKSDFVLNDFTFSNDTPHDMAEYIFWTGDENSVINAVRDFVNQGLITDAEGKEFMDQVQHDLHQIRLRYGTNVDKTAPTAPPENTKNIPNDNEEDNESQQLTELLKPSNKALSAEGQKSHKGEIVVTSYGPASKPSNEPLETGRVQDETKTRGTTPSNTKEEHLNEAHIVDLLSNQYTLEEILYQLARILFSQSLSQEAEEALRKFADFLEKESKEGKMSPELQKKVLDVLLMSLFDSMADQHMPLLPGVKLSPTERPSATAKH
ncbi:uncharacterized protein LOC130687478 isoform X2 [Daphnia carinata]|uniref:uncharacterized protein LOC130687478 isoform X2 n=1 Tax=Daphnia carinata TaxID=120202 RepID=UPI002868B479|nr:uncharacterized protein LOC130687478 isoform X2 [Daphnia carinata]